MNTTPESRLLELYDRVAKAPNAIDRLRKFVLDLAVRGKLVEQDQADEPASKLLERIAAEKARLFNAGQIRKPTDLEDVGNDERGFETPQGWTWSRLGSLTLITQGFAFSSGDYSKSAEDGYPLIKIGDIGSNTPEVFIKGNYDPVYLVQPGDLLLGLSGSIKCANWRGPIALLNQRIARIRPATLDLTDKWLFLSVSSCLDRWKAETSKLTVQNIKAKQLNEAPVALPPLPEQHRIVAKVDDLMTLLDRLETTRTQRETTRNRLTAASLARLTALETTEKEFHAHARFAINTLPTLTARPDQIKVLRQTILNLAVRGKLVEQDPADEPASNLVEDAKHRMAELVELGKAGKMKEIAPIQKHDELFDLPIGWCWTRLGKLSRLITKGSSPKWQGIQYVEKEHGILFVTSENVGIYKLSKLESPKYVERRFNEIEPRSILEKGDLLLNLVGASIGRAAEFELDEVANINQAVALIRPICSNEFFVTRFILHYLNSPTGVAEMLGSRAIAAQPNISLTDTRNFLIPLPPLAEQQRIVAKVDALMALCEKLEAAFTKAEITRVRLLETLIHEAFQSGNRNKIAA